MRVVILKEFVKKHFPATPVMDYAIAVEKITTSKVSVPLGIGLVPTGNYFAFGILGS